jgi:hypothetical protein
MKPIINKNKMIEVIPLLSCSSSVDGNLTVLRESMAVLLEPSSGYDKEIKLLSLTHGFI